jgi:hypothetical protein
MIFVNMKKLKLYNEDLEGDEEILPFSSIYVTDYFDKIEQGFEEQANKRGKPSQKWKDYMNGLIEDCEKLRRKYLPATDKKRVYDRIK